MKFCSKCGKEIHEDAAICVHCGCAVAEAKPEVKQDNNNLPRFLLTFFPLNGKILMLCETKIPFS